MRTLRTIFLAAWPFLAVVALTAVIVAAVLSVVSTIDQRDTFAEQAEHVRELVQVQREEIANRDANEKRQREAEADRLAIALEESERVSREQYDDLIARIEVLLSRPAGVPVDPVSARGLGEGAPRASSAAPSHPAPRTTTPRTAPSATGGTTAHSPPAPEPPGCAKGKAKKC